MPRKHHKDTIQVTRPGWLSALKTSHSAEELLLSVLITINKAEVIDDVRGVLKLEHIHDLRIRVAIEAIYAFSAEGRPWGPEFVAPIVAERMEHSLEDTADWLIGLLNVTGHASVSAAVEYALSVVRQWQRRELLYGLQELDNDLASAELSVGEAIDKTMAICERLKGTDFSTEEDHSLKAAIEEFVDEPDDETINTHLMPLDTALRGGMRRKQLIVVGARPSVGKSALLGQIAIKAACDGIPVLYLSFEMSRREMVGRWVSQQNWHLDDETDRGRYQETPINLMECGNWSIDRVESEARRHVSRNNIQIVVLDYLNLIRPSGSGRSRVEQLGEITGRLKQLAMQHNIVVLTAAQFNRAKEGRDEARPKMSDFRESGSIEQDADILFGIDRDIKEGATPEATLYLMKNRGGKTARIDLEFQKERVLFVERVNDYSNFDL